MGIITKMRKQTAVYWPPLEADEYGKPTYDDPVEVTCRWEDTQKLFVTPQGSTETCASIVYVDRDVEVGGVLLLGSLDSDINESDPKANEGASEIRQFSKIPNIRNTELLRVAYL